MSIVSFHSIKYHLILIIALFSLVVSAASPSDSIVLLDIYNQCDGSNWDNIEVDSAWDASKPIHQWKGVTLDGDGRVVELDLSYNNLSGLLPESIGGLNELRNLDLTGNLLVNIPGRIGALNKLDSLKMGSNDIQSFTTELTALQNLKLLDLSNNEIEILPETIGNLTSLKSLHLGSNNLQSLPLSIGGLINLEYLYLSFNFIKILPNEFCFLKRLKELDLHSNEINALPSDFGELSSLERLSLVNNSLNSLPETIGELENLVGLYLSANKITTLPPSIGGLLNLEEFHVSNNSLDSLPSTIGNLTSLLTLGVNDNKLVTVPISVSRLEKLEVISINSNKLIDLPFEVLVLPETQKWFVWDNYLCFLDSSLARFLDVRNEGEWLTSQKCLRCPKISNALNNLDLKNGAELILDLEGIDSNKCIYTTDTLPLDTFYFSQLDWQVSNISSHLSVEIVEGQHLKISSDTSLPIGTELTFDINLTRDGYDFINKKEFDCFLGDSKTVVVEIDYPDLYIKDVKLVQLPSGDFEGSFIAPVTNNKLQFDNESIFLPGFNTSSGIKLLSAELFSVPLSDSLINDNEVLYSFSFTPESIVYDVLDAIKFTFKGWAADAKSVTFHLPITDGYIDPIVKKITVPIYFPDADCPKINDNLKKLEIVENSSLEVDLNKVENGRSFYTSVLGENVTNNEWFVSNVPNNVSVDLNLSNNKLKITPSDSLKAGDEFIFKLSVTRSDIECEQDSEYIRVKLISQPFEIKDLTLQQVSSGLFKGSFKTIKTNRKLSFEGNRVNLPGFISYFGLPANSAILNNIFFADTLVGVNEILYTFTFASDAEVVGKYTNKKQKFYDWASGCDSITFEFPITDGFIEPVQKELTIAVDFSAPKTDVFISKNEMYAQTVSWKKLSDKVKINYLDVIGFGAGAKLPQRIILSEEQKDAAQIRIDNLDDSRLYEYRLALEDSLGNTGISSVTEMTLSDYYSVSGILKGNFQDVEITDVSVKLYHNSDSGMIFKKNGTISIQDSTKIIHTFDSVMNGEYIVIAEVTNFYSHPEEFPVTVLRSSHDSINFEVAPYPVVDYDGVRITQQEGTGDLLFTAKAILPFVGEYPSAVILRWVPSVYSDKNTLDSARFKIDTYESIKVNDTITYWRFNISRDSIESRLSSGTLDSSFTGSIRYVQSVLETQTQNFNTGVFRNGEWSYPHFSKYDDEEDDSNSVIVDTNFSITFAPQLFKSLETPLVTPPLMTSNSANLEVGSKITSSAIKAEIKYYTSDDAQRGVFENVKVVDLYPVVPSHVRGLKRYSTHKINWDYSVAGVTGRQDLFNSFHLSHSSLNMGIQVLDKSLPQSVENKQSYAKWLVEMKSLLPRKYYVWLYIESLIDEDIALNCDLKVGAKIFNLHKNIKSPKRGWVRLDCDTTIESVSDTAELKIYAPSQNVFIGGFSVNSERRSFNDDEYAAFRRIDPKAEELVVKKVKIDGLPSDRRMNFEISLVDRFGNRSTKQIFNDFLTQDNYFNGDLSLSQQNDSGSLELKFKTPDMSGILETFKFVKNIGLQYFTVFYADKAYRLPVTQNTLDGTVQDFTFSKALLDSIGLLSESKFIHNASYDSIGLKYTFETEHYDTSYSKHEVETPLAHNMELAPDGYTDCVNESVKEIFKEVRKRRRRKGLFARIFNLWHEWSEWEKENVYVYEYMKIDTINTVVAGNDLIYYCPNGDNSLFSSQEYRNPSKPELSLVEKDARTIKLNCSNLNSDQSGLELQQMAGRLEVTWEPGSLCQDSTVISIPFGNTFTQDENGDIFYAPSFYSAVESDNGNWVTVNTRSAKHQWLDDVSGKGGTFFPNIGFNALNEGTAASVSPYISHRVFIDEKDNLETTFSLWVLSEGEYKETSNEVIVEVMNGISEGRASHFDGALSTSKHVTITSSDWVYCGTVVLKNGFNTVSLFMVEDGLEINGLALTKGGVPPIKTSSELKNWDSSNRGFDLNINSQDLASNQEISFRAVAVDRFGNRSDTTFADFKTESVNKKIPKVIITPIGISGEFFSSGIPEFSVSIDGEYDYPLQVNVVAQKNVEGVSEDITNKFYAVDSLQSPWRYTVYEAQQLFTHPEGPVTLANNYMFYAQVEDTLNNEVSDWTKLEFGILNDSTKSLNYLHFNDPYYTFIDTIGEDLFVEFHSAYIAPNGEIVGKLMVNFDDGLTEDYLLLENISFEVEKETIEDDSLGSYDIYTKILSYDLSNSHLSVYRFDHSRKNFLEIGFGKFKTEIPIIDSIAVLDTINGNIVIAEDGLSTGIIYDDNGAEVRFTGPEEAGVAAPLTLNSSGYSTSLFARRDNFFLRNVHNTVKGKDGFHFTSCITTFSQSDSVFTILAARECDGCSDKYSGPYLTYDVVDPKMGGIEFSNYDALSEPMEVAYTGVTGDYQIHWELLDSNKNSIEIAESKREVLQYRNWSIIPHSYTFTNSGLSIDTFDLLLDQNPLQLELDSLPQKVANFTGLEIKAVQGVNEGVLHLFGNATSSVADTGLTLEMNGGYIAYLHGDFTFSSIDDGKDYLLKHTNGGSIDLPVYLNKSFSVAGNISSVFNGNGDQGVVNVPLGDVEFNSSSITSLSGSDNIDLSVGKVVNIRGKITVQFLNDYFDIDLQPTSGSEGVIYIVLEDDSFLQGLLELYKDADGTTLEFSPNSASLSIYDEFKNIDINTNFSSSMLNDYAYDSLSFTSIKLSDLSFNMFLVKSLQLSKAVLLNKVDEISESIPQVVPAALLFSDILLRSNGYDITDITSLSEQELSSIASRKKVTEISLPGGYDIAEVSNWFETADKREATSKALVLISNFFNSGRSEADSYLNDELHLSTKDLTSLIPVLKSNIKLAPDFSIYTLYGLIDLKNLTAKGSIIPPEFKDILDIPIDGVEISAIRKRGEKKLMLALLNPQIDVKKLFNKDSDDGSKSESIVDLHNFAIDQDLELQALNGKIALGKLQESLRKNVSFLGDISENFFKLSMNDLFVGFGRTYSEYEEFADLSLKTSGAITLGSIFAPIGLEGESILLDKLESSYRSVKSDEGKSGKWSLDALEASSSPQSRVIPLFGKSDSPAPVELISGGKGIGIQYDKKAGDQTLDVVLNNWTLRITESFPLEPLRGLSFHIDKMVYGAKVGEGKGSVKEFEASAEYKPTDGNLQINDYGLGDVTIRLKKDNTDPKANLGVYLEVAFETLLLGEDTYLNMNCTNEGETVFRVYLDGGFYFKGCATWEKNISLVPFGEDYDANTTKVYIDAKGTGGGAKLDLEIGSDKGFTGVLKDVHIKSRNDFFKKVDEDLELNVLLKEVGMRVKDKKVEVTRFDAMWFPKKDFLDGSDKMSLTLDAVRLGFTGDKAITETMKLFNGSVSKEHTYNFAPKTFFLAGGLSFQSKINDDCQTSVLPILSYSFQKDEVADIPSQTIDYDKGFTWRIDGMLDCKINGMKFGAQVQIEKDLVGFPLAYIHHDKLRDLLKGDDSKKPSFTPEFEKKLKESKYLSDTNKTVFSYPDNMAGAIVENAFWKKLGGKWTFNPDSTFKPYPTFDYTKALKVPGVGIYVVGTFNFEDLFNKPIGIGFDDVKVRLSDKMGSAEIPTGFSFTLNGKKPYLHPSWDMPNPITVPIPAIGLTDDIKLGGAMMSLGYTEGEIDEKTQEADKSWYFSGMATMSLPGAFEELTVDVGFEEPNPPINFTGIHHAIITLRLAYASRISLSGTPFYIAGFRGGLYDGHAVPLSAQACGFKKMSPGLKMDAAILLEFQEPRVMAGEVGFWTHLMALNFGISGHVKGFGEIMSADACAAIYNGGTAFHSELGVTIGKGLIVQGEFLADAWIDNSGPNFTAQALARLGLKKASLVKRKIIKIPRKDRMFGDFYAALGKFENETRGAMAGLRFFGRKWGVGVINRKFVIGNLGKYRLKQAPLYTQRSGGLRSDASSTLPITLNGDPILSFDGDSYVLINTNLEGLTGNEVISVAGGVSRGNYEWPEHAFKIAYKNASGSFVIDTVTQNYTVPVEDSGNVGGEIHDEPYNMKMRMWVNNESAEEIYLAVPALTQADNDTTKFEYMILAGLKQPTTKIEVEALDSARGTYSFTGTITGIDTSRVHVTTVDGDDTTTVLSQLSELKFFTSQITPMDNDKEGAKANLQSMIDIKLSEFDGYKSHFTSIADFPDDVVEFDEAAGTLTLKGLKWNASKFDNVGGTFKFVSSVDVYDFVVYDEDGNKAVFDDDQKSQAAFYRMEPKPVTEVGSNEILTFTIKTPEPVDTVNGLVATGSEATANWIGRDESRNIYVNWEVDPRASGYKVTWYPKGTPSTTKVITDSVNPGITYDKVISHSQTVNVGKTDSYIIRIPDIKPWYSKVREYPNAQKPTITEFYDTIAVTYKTKAYRDSVYIKGYDTISVDSIVPLYDTITLVSEVDTVVKKPVLDSVYVQKHEVTDTLKLWGENVDTTYYFAKDFDIVVTPYFTYLDTVDTKYGFEENEVEVTETVKRFADIVALADTTSASLGENSGKSFINDLSISLLDSANTPVESSVIEVPRNSSGFVNVEVAIDNFDISTKDASNYVGLFSKYGTVGDSLENALPTIGVYEDFTLLSSDTLKKRINFTPISKDQTCAEVFERSCTKEVTDNDGTVIDTVDCGCGDGDPYEDEPDSVRKKLSPCYLMGDSLLRRATPVGDYPVYIYAVNNGKRENPGVDSNDKVAIDTVTFRVLPPEPIVHMVSKDFYVFGRPDTILFSVSGLDVDKNFKIHFNLIEPGVGKVFGDTLKSSQFSILAKEDLPDNSFMRSGETVIAIPTSLFNYESFYNELYTLNFSFENIENGVDGTEFKSQSEAVAISYLRYPEDIECNDNLSLDDSLSPYAMDWFGNYPKEPTLGDTLTVYFSELFETSKENFIVTIRKYNSPGDTSAVDSLVISDYLINDHSIRFVPLMSFINSTDYFELETNLTNGQSKCANQEWGKGEFFKFNNKRSYAIEEVRKDGVTGFRVVLANDYLGNRSDKLRYYIGNYAKDGGIRYKHYPSPEFVAMNESNFVTVIYSDKNSDNEVTLKKFIKVDEIPRLVYPNGDTVAASFNALPGDTVIIDYMRDGFSDNFDNSANRSWYHFKGKESVHGQDTIVLTSSDSGFVEVGVERILRARMGSNETAVAVGSRFYTVHMKIDSLISSSDMFVLPHGKVRDACSTSIESYLFTTTIKKDQLSVPLDSIAFRSSNLLPLKGRILPGADISSVIVQVELDTIDGNRIDNRFYVSKGQSNSQGLLNTYRFVTSCESGGTLVNSVKETEFSSIGLTTESGVLGKSLRFNGTEVPAVACKDLFTYRDRGVTASLWIYLDSLNSGELIKLSDVNGKSVFHFSADKDGSLIVGLNGDEVRTSGNTLEPNTWLHVAASAGWYGSKDSLQIYVNGELQVARAGSGLSANFSDSVSVSVGRGFKGLIDEVRVAPKVLEKGVVALDYEFMNPYSEPMSGKEDYAELQSISKAERAILRGFKEGVAPYSNDSYKVGAISDIYEEYAYLSRPVEGDSVITISYDNGGQLLLLVPENDDKVQIPEGFIADGKRVKLLKSEVHESQWYDVYEASKNKAFTLSLAQGGFPAPILLIKADTTEHSDWVTSYSSSMKVHKDVSIGSLPYFDRHYRLRSMPESLSDPVLISSSNSKKGSGDQWEFLVDDYANMHLFIESGTTVDTTLLYSAGWRKDSLLVECDNFNLKSFSKKRAAGVEILPSMANLSRNDYIGSFLLVEKGEAEDTIIKGLKLDTLYTGVLLYDDTNIVCSNLSSDLNGLPFKRTLQGDYNSTDESRFGLQLAQARKVYCAIDARQTLPPLFIKEIDSVTGAWAEHQGSFVVNDSLSMYRIYSKELPSGYHEFQGARYGASNDNRYNYFLIFGELDKGDSDTLDGDSLDIVTPYWGLHSKSLEITGVGGSRSAQSENFSIEDISIVNGYSDSLTSPSWNLSATITSGYVRNSDTVRVLSVVADTFIVDSSDTSVDYIDVKDEQILQDLIPSLINANSVVVSAKTLETSGQVTVSFKNSGTAPVLDSFRVILFEDNNGDYRYDPFYDTEIGTEMVAPISAGSLVLKSFALDKNLSFPERTLFAFIDADYQVTEINEQNNTIQSNSPCDSFSAVTFIDTTISDSTLMQITNGYEECIVGSFIDMNNDSLIDEIDGSVLIYIRENQLYVSSHEGDSLRYGGYVDYLNGYKLRLIDVDGSNKPELLCGNLLLSHNLDTLYAGEGVPAHQYDFNGDGLVDTVSVAHGVTVIHDGSDGRLLYVSDRDKWLFPVDSTTVSTLAEIVPKVSNCYDISVSFPRIEHRGIDSLGRDSLHCTVRIANSGVTKLVGPVHVGLQVVDSLGNQHLYKEDMTTITSVESYSDISFTLVIDDYETKTFTFVGDTKNKWFECNEENNSISQSYGEQ